MRKFQRAELSYIVPASIALLVAGSYLEYVYDRSGVASPNFITALYAVVFTGLGVGLFVRPRRPLLLVLALFSALLAAGDLHRFFINEPAEKGRFAAKYPSLNELLLWVLPVSAAVGWFASLRARKAHAA